MTGGGERLVVHMVGNAHIDPVWLWRWQAGVDEALASFRSAAERCDEFPEFRFTRGEAWLYRQVERLDPELFARVRRLIERGQWHVEGGQFIQPDVNAPTEAGLLRQFLHGQQYFETRFGVRPWVGYNLDSFGHPATLPDVLQAAGCRAYVFHRPMPAQLALPSQTFRWRGSGGGEVVAFRIVPGYNTPGQDLGTQVAKAVEAADRSLGHTMAFYGVGNHGGGPTKADIVYVLENRDALDGVELRFSTPREFFEAIEDRRDRLPVVDAELQHTFPGCYSVMHRVKQRQRHGEHLLEQARQVIAAFGGEAGERLTQKLDEAWEDLLFTAFHDVLAGTSIPSAWPSVEATQGRARIAGEEIVLEATRSWARQTLPGVNHHQIVVLNPDLTERRDVIEVEPWLDMDRWGSRWLSDLDGDPIDYQLVQAEAPQITTRLLIPVVVPAGGAAHLLVRDDPAPADPASPVVQTDLRVSTGGMSNSHLEVLVDAHGVRSLRSEGRELLGDGGIRLHLRADPTDTWTFHTDRFTEPVTEVFEGSGWVVEEAGPLRARLRTEGRVGSSRLRWTLDLYRNEARFGMRVEINFDERHTLLQLPVELRDQQETWSAGLAGGSVVRTASDVEWPVQGWSCVSTSQGALGLVTQDAYSLSMDGRRWQWTLLRSPRMAWGGGDNDSYAGRDWFTDQGLHTFDLEFLAGASLEPDALTFRAEQVARPLVVFDRYEGLDRPLGRRPGPTEALFHQDE